MNPIAKTYITYPQARIRLRIGLVCLGLPCLFFLAWLLQGDEWQWFVDGKARMFWKVVFYLLFTIGLGFFFVIGIYGVFFTERISVDRMNGQVTRTLGVFSWTVRRKVWPLSEFKQIEVRHWHDLDWPRDTFQTDVGIKHASGLVLWLRVFWPTSAAGPSEEARVFIGELTEVSGLAERFSECAPG